MSANVNRQCLKSALKKNTHNTYVSNTNGILVKRRKRIFGTAFCGTGSSSTLLTSVKRSSADKKAVHFNSDVLVYRITGRQNSDVRL